MCMKKILICGDSFSSDWTIKYQGEGWPNMISRDYEVTNLAQAGCSQYRIYLQLCSANIHDYDAVLVSHTSPNRIYIEEHPVHKNDPLHQNADLIYTDIKAHAEANSELTCIVDFYEKYFDLGYAAFVHNLICEKIDGMFQNYRGKVVHITNLPRDGLYVFDDMLFFDNLTGKKYKGLMNHYNDRANKIVYDTVRDVLKDI